VALVAVSAASLPSGGSRTEFDCAFNRSVEELRSDVALQPRDLTQMTFKNCNLTELDFSFLAEYPNLDYLRVQGGWLAEFKRMPVVPELKYVRISTAGFQRWWGPSLTPKLNDVELQFIADDVIMDGIVDSLMDNEDTLEYLHLSDSGLSRVPAKVHRFTRLKQFYFYNNPRTFRLTNGTFPAAFKPQVLDIGDTIRTIEPGTFADNFQDRFLYLTKSNLDRFDEGVFGPVLRSMSGNYGTLVLNRVGDCDCNLAWLARDNRHLLASLGTNPNSNVTAQCYQPSTGYWIDLVRIRGAEFEKCAKGAATPTTSSTLLLLTAAIFTFMP